MAFDSHATEAKYQPRNLAACAKQPNVVGLYAVLKVNLTFDHVLGDDAIYIANSLEVVFHSRYGGRVQTVHHRPNKVFSLFFPP